MKICIAFQSIAANEKNGDFILLKKIADGTLLLLADRSEERRVGKECRCRGARDD